MERVKIEMEYVFRASPQVLYKFFTTPDLLIRWFCDAVDINDDIYEFDWEGYIEEARLIDDIEEERIRFAWTNADNEEEYFEFSISVSPVTGDTILNITDFCDSDEVKDQKALWDSQLSQLKRETGEGL